MIEIENKNLCSGCKACAQICQANAIGFADDSKGFWYPQVQPETCTHCGLCQKACMYEQPSLPTSTFEKKFFGVRHKNMHILESSQSGGLFYGLAQVILREGGVCYGAAIEDHFRIKQIRVEQESDLVKLQGSKYVQSDVNTTYQMAEADLRKGISVLYTGTSCIIAGLLQYLDAKKVPMLGLITCDLICNGVQSPKVFQDNIDRLEESEGSAIESLTFRDKRFGWKGQCYESYLLANGTEKTEHYFLELYADKTLVRDSCFSCNYVDCSSKPADITMGDFWAVTECNPAFAQDNKGCSFAAIHTKKGFELFQKGEFEYFETSQADAMKKNLAHAPQKIVQYSQFWNTYQKKGLPACLKKYTSYGGITVRIKRKLLKIAKRW